MVIPGTPPTQSLGAEPVAARRRLSLLVKPSAAIYWFNQGYALPPNHVVLICTCCQSIIRQGSQPSNTLHILVIVRIVGRALGISIGIFRFEVGARKMNHTWRRPVCFGSRSLLRVDPLAATAGIFLSQGAPVEHEFEGFYAPPLLGGRGLTPPPSDNPPGPPRLPARLGFATAGNPVTTPCGFLYHLRERRCSIVCRPP